jgi:TonB family protein
MNALWKEDNLFWEALVASVAMHLFMMHAGAVSFRWSQKHTVEIDITNMRRIGAPVAARKTAPSPAPKSAKPPEKPKEWLKPAENQKVAPAPVPTKPVAPAPEEPPSEIPIGSGEGGEVMLTHLPQLLNLSDLGAILQRFYPEKAREDGREATVVMDIHIGRDGQITAVEVVQSADLDFDSAAVRVAKLLRFKPAYVNGQPVAVKMRQPIQFRLAR